MKKTKKFFTLKVGGPIDGAPELISKNYAAAKGVAALTVMFGHYTAIPNFWVIVTMALLVFSISSGYFTWQRYHTSFSIKKFYKKKILRLLPQLLLIEVFLFTLFSYQKREGLYSIDTVINLIGMNGFMNWLRIHNDSPYGAGMWFLTLLLVFYFFYPLIELAFRRRTTAVLMTLSSLTAFFILNHTVVYGHALWLTASGFFVGIFLARFQIRSWWRLAVVF